jgi:hypothetical protein
MKPGSYRNVRIGSARRLLVYADDLPKVKRPQWWLFRGTSQPFPLQTSLERALTDAGVSLSGASDFEQQMLKEFKRRAHHHVNPLPNHGDVLGWLALMQHYGAPTRLLDWTYSFYVAAFFALAEAISLPAKRRRPAVVWALYRDEFKLGQQAPDANAAYEREAGRSSWQDDVGRADADNIYDGINGYLVSVMETPQPSVWAINTFVLNERLSVQKGVFLCPGDVTIPFEDNLRAGHPTPAKLVRFELSTTPRARRDMLQALDRMNINNTSLFPGLDGFARSLRQLPWVRFRLRPFWPSHQK